MRLAQYGPNAIDAARRAGPIGLYARQFKSPLVLILIVASVVSLVATEWIDAGVVLVVVLGSTILGCVQEYIASNAVLSAGSLVRRSSRCFSRWRSRWGWRPNCCPPSSASPCRTAPNAWRAWASSCGAPNVLAMCDRVRDGKAAAVLDAAARAQIEASYDAWSTQGFRVLGVASRVVEPRSASYSRVDETGMCFEGFLLFLDPPKDDVPQTLADLAQRGVQLKMITGDNHKVARHIAQAIGLPVEVTLTGARLNAMSDEALLHAAQQATVFAEVDPDQKERIILALRKMGHVVGYMGDGINDAPALHGADVGISVDTAVDVAKDAADFVLLRKDLTILRAGIDEGRMIFANTLKYILTTISANFGNMFSMAAASVLLPFLPLLASQILLNVAKRFFYLRR